MQGWPWCQLHVEIVYRILKPDRQGRAIIREDYEPRAMLDHSLDEVEGFVAVASRENPAQIRIACESLRHQNRAIRSMKEFSTEDGFEAGLSRYLKKPNGSIQSIRIRQREGVLSLCAYRLAEYFQRRDARHGGIG
jgi:hypothetical protein